MKMFPEFDGRWAYGWIITVEQHCEAKGVSEEKKFSEAEKVLTRDAFIWWYSWRKRNQRAKWWDFVIALLREFEPGSELYLPDQVEDSGEEEIPGEEEIQKEEARNIKASNLELRRNWCEEWIKSRGYGDEQRREGGGISENEKTEDDLTENNIIVVEEMTIAAKLQICDILQESRGEAAGEMLSVKQPPPQPLDRSCHAAVEETLRGVEWKQTQKRPPPKPPELVDRGGNPAAYSTTPAPARSATQATLTTVRKVAKDEKEIFQQGGAKLELQRISQVLPLSQHLRPPFDLMGLAQHESSCFATGNLLLTLLIVFGKIERKLQNLGLLFKPIDCGPVVKRGTGPFKKILSTMNLEDASVKEQLQPSFSAGIGRKNLCRRLQLYQVLEHLAQEQTGNISNWLRSSNELDAQFQNLRPQKFEFYTLKWRHAQLNSSVRENKLVDKCMWEIHKNFLCTFGKTHQNLKVVHEDTMSPQKGNGNLIFVLLLRKLLITLRSVKLGIILWFQPAVPNAFELRRWDFNDAKINWLRWQYELNWMHFLVIYTHRESSCRLQFFPIPRLLIYGSASVASCWFIVSAGLEFGFHNRDSQVTDFNKLRGRQEHIAWHQPSGSTLNSCHFCSHGSRGVIVCGDSTAGRVKDLWAHYMDSHRGYYCMLFASWLEGEKVPELLSNLLKAQDLLSAQDKKLQRQLDLLTRNWLNSLSQLHKSRLLAVEPYQEFNVDSHGNLKEILSMGMEEYELEKVLEIPQQNQFSFQVGSSNIQGWLHYNVRNYTVLPEVVETSLSPHRQNIPHLRDANAADPNEPHATTWSTSFQQWDPGGGFFGGSNIHSRRIFYIHP